MNKYIQNNEKRDIFILKFYKNVGYPGESTKLIKDLNLLSKYVDFTHSEQYLQSLNAF